MKTTQAILSILDSISNIGAAGQNIYGIYQTITGSDGTSKIINAIDNLDSDIKQGFANLEQVITEQTSILQWQQFSDSLRTMFNQTQTFIEDLATIQQANTGANSGEWVVIAQSNEITFANWCQSDDGPLITLPQYVQYSNYDTNNPSLAGMFKAVYSSSDALDLWEQISKVAQKSSLPSLEKYKNQTVFALTSQFMSEVYFLLCMIYYAHEAALKALTAIQRQTTFQPIQSLVFENFGNVSTNGTVWSSFAENLYTLSATPIFQDVDGSDVNSLNPKGQYMQCALSGDSYPTNPNQYTGTTDDEQFYFLINECTCTTPNSFFASLQIDVVSPPLDLPTTMIVLILRGTQVTIGPDMQMTIGETIPFPADFQSNWGVMSINPANSVQFFDYSMVYEPKDYFNALYVVPPPPPSGTMSVITGFKFLEMGNRIALGLQYGNLDLQEPSNPTINISDTSFLESGVSQSGNAYGSMQSYVDLRPTGAYSIDANGNPVDDCAFLSNVALCVTYGNRLGLNVQTAVPIYEADFFQPTSLQSIQ